MSDATNPPPSTAPSRRRWPILRFVWKRLRTWLERHQDPVNLGLHLAGIPLAVAGVVLFFVLPWSAWYWAAGALVLGYLLQYIGHRIEGNDVGEWAAIKRLLGLPYVAVSPRWQKGPRGGA